MKTLKLFITLGIITAVMTACNFVEWDEIDPLGFEPTPIKKIPKLYPGGNADCSTIGINGLVETTGRINYNPATDSFDGIWPAGLLVKVFNGTSVSWQIDGSIDLGDGKCYKVGAVIVKGGDASNVYDYTRMGGATMDAGLVPPNNTGGNQAALSNLTFCFVECNLPDLVIALKVFYQAADAYWAVTGGPNAIGSEINSLRMGYFNYVYGEENTFILYRRGYPDAPGGGSITVTDYIDSIDGIHYLEVVFNTYNNENWTYKATHLYVGSASGYNNYLTTGGDGITHTDYGRFPFFEDKRSPTRSFKIPLSDITE